MHEFDLVIVGTGSGNSIPGPEFDDWNIAIVEKGVFGGTCLNVGCIPSKMFVYAADVAETIRHAKTYGIDAQINGVDWPAIRDRVFGRIDPIANGGEEYRRGEECPNITVFGGEGRFTGPKTIDVKLPDGTTEQLTGRHIVLGAGARPFVPPYPGIETVEYHTSDTIMRLDALPERLIVMGGGYIAAELGHVFEGLGSQVTMINRSDTLLRAEDDDIRERFTDVFARRVDMRCGSTVEQVWQDDDGVHVTLTRRGHTEQVDGDTLLVATGRVPNGDLLEVGAAGVLTELGRVPGRRALPHQHRGDLGLRRPVEHVPAEAPGQRRGPGPAPEPADRRRAGRGGSCRRWTPASSPTPCSAVPRWPRWG